MGSERYKVKKKKIDESLLAIGFYAPKKIKIITKL